MRSSYSWLALAPRRPLNSSIDTFRFIIKRKVITNIRKSTKNEALRMYHSSNASFSSFPSSLAPLTCAQPLMPGRTASLVARKDG